MLSELASKRVNMKAGNNKNRSKFIVDKVSSISKCLKKPKKKILKYRDTPPIVSNGNDRYEKLIRRFIIEIINNQTLRPKITNTSNSSSTGRIEFSCCVEIIKIVINRTADTNPKVLDIKK